MDIGRLPEKGKNNLWFRHNESDAVLVFVHGLLSDSRGCWLYESKRHPERNCYWPELIESDSRFNDISIYLAGYYTAVDSGAYEIRNCADEVMAALKYKDIDGRQPVMEKAKITFVCHSLGGIVARYLLETNREEFKDKKVGLALIASPSFGSKLANSLDNLIDFFHQQQGVQLKWGNWSLSDLDDRFKTLKDEKLIPNLSGIELYENHFVVHCKWLPIFKRKLVVTKESAGRYFSSPKQIAKTDHFSICKPVEKTDLVHKYLYNFLSKNELLPGKVGSSASERILTEPTPNVSRPPAPVVQPPPRKAQPHLESFEAYLAQRPAWEAAETSAIEEGTVRLRVRADGSWKGGIDGLRPTVSRLLRMDGSVREVQVLHEHLMNLCREYLTLEGATSLTIEEGRRHNELHLVLPGLLANADRMATAIRVVFMPSTANVGFSVPGDVGLDLERGVAFVDALLRQADLAPSPGISRIIYYPKSVYSLWARSCVDDTAAAAFRTRWVEALQKKFGFDPSDWPIDRKTYRGYNLALVPGWALD